VTDSTYDRLLIVLATLAPLTLMILNRWQASWNHWYAPMDGAELIRIDADLKRSAAAWLQDTAGTGARLYLVVDRDCPCTAAASKRLAAALSETRRPDVSLDVIDIDDSAANRNPAWRALVDEVPATPTLIAADGKRLVYAGPAISGNLCTATVQRFLGLSALQAPMTTPVVSLVDKGCYCRTDRSSRAAWMPSKTATS